MPVITSIKQQKINNRANIYLDGKFGFGIDVANLVTLRLKVDQELTEKEVEEIVKKAEFQKTLDNLLRFATLRPRSKKEIRDYFKRKKVHESLQPELMIRLEKFDLINDEEFSRWWVDQRQSFRPKPKRILHRELLIKGVEREIIKKVLSEGEIDEEKMARELIAKKTQKWNGLSPREARLKKSQYLAGKGFGWEIIEKIVDEVVK